MKSFTVREVLKLLEQAGWEQVRPAPHRKLKHRSRPGAVTVAGKLGDEIPTGTLRSVFRQAGLPWPPVSKKK